MQFGNPFKLKNPILSLTAQEAMVEVFMTH